MQLQRGSLLAVAALVGTFAVGCAAQTSDSDEEKTDESAEAISVGWHHVVWPVAGLRSAWNAPNPGQCVSFASIDKDFHAGHQVYVYFENKDCVSNYFYAYVHDAYWNLGWIRVDALSAGP